MTKVLVNVLNREILQTESGDLPFEDSYPLKWIDGPPDANRFWNYNPQGDVISKPSDYIHRIITDKLNQLAHFRWRKESSGITFNGNLFDTSEASQIKLAGAVLKAEREADPAYFKNWKTPSGWVVLTKADIIALGEAVDLHIQTCYDKEKTIADQIISLTDEFEILNFDFEPLWD